MSTHHTHRGCENCRRKAKQREYEHKRGIEGEFKVNTKLYIDQGGDYKNSIKPANIQAPSKSSRQAAIVLMTPDDDVTKSKVYFGSGIAINGLNQRFDVNSDGSSIKFRVAGLYELQFQGVISSRTDIATLSFRKTPDFDAQHIPFSKAEISSGEVSKSTILPFDKGDRLEVLLKSTDGSQVAIGKGTKLLVVRVDDK